MAERPKGYGMTAELADKVKEKFLFFFSVIDVSCITFVYEIM